MKIVTKMTGDALVARSFEQRGLSAKPVKNDKIIVDLPVDSVFSKTKFYKVVPEVYYDLRKPNENFFIQCASFTMSGEYSMVPCDTFGNVLTPFFVPRTEADGTGHKETGLYSAREMVTVLVVRDTVVIKKAVIVPIVESKEHYLFISERTLYKGKISELPKRMLDFLPAIKIAIRRINEGKENSSNIGSRYEV